MGGAGDGLHVACERRGQGDPQVLGSGGAKTEGGGEVRSQSQTRRACGADGTPRWAAEGHLDVGLQESRAGRRGLQSPSRAQGELWAKDRASEPDPEAAEEVRKKQLEQPKGQEEDRQALLSEERGPHKHDTEIQSKKQQRPSPEHESAILCPWPWVPVLLLICSVILGKSSFFLIDREHNPSQGDVRAAAWRGPPLSSAPPASAVTIAGVERGQPLSQGFIRCLSSKPTLPPPALRMLEWGPCQPPCPHPLWLPLPLGGWKMGEGEKGPPVCFPRGSASLQRQPGTTQRACNLQVS